MRLAYLLLALPLAAAETASVSGRVVNANSGSALRKVNLTLTPTRGKTKPATAESDENGRFVFPEVAPGGYRLSGQRSGYPNPERPLLLLVAPGKSLEDVTFRLTPGAVISGRVLDQEGEPMPNLVVSLLRKRYEHGKLDWRRAGAAQTNDRGEYRIANLRSGRYLLNAADLNIGIDLAGVSRNPMPDKPEQTYASTYLGNTTDLERAVPVDLREGEDRRGTDIQMVRSSTVRVRGKVIGADGRMLVLTVVRKGAAPGSSSGGIAVVQPAEGSFEIKGLTPGSYLLIARSVSDGVRPSGAPVPLEVGEQHIDGFEMRLTDPGSLAGTVTLAGRPAAAGVRLERVDFDLADLVPEAKAGEDGVLTVPGVPAGRYRVNVHNLPEGACLQTVRFSGSEVDPGGADVAPGGKLEILLAQGAQVEGKVTGAEDKPVSGATVVLMPASGRESQYAVATSDPDGTFVLKGVAPGRYQALAWETLEPGAWLDPEFVKPFAAGAQALAVEANSHTRLALKPAAKDR